MPLTTALLYWHTLRYLRPVQIYGRLRFRLARPQPDTAAAPGLRTPEGHWVTPARREPRLKGPETFVFLGQAGDLNTIGWDGPQREKLWRYNQHYFDDLNAHEAARRNDWHQNLLCRWVQDNPPAAGTGWEPYPTSLRIVNWIKWALAGNTLPERCLHSLAVQARWLCRRLEYHLLGNHLFANAKALVFAGAFFEGKEADGWLQRGLAILAEQFPEQILDDGGHFERSTMYHALALEDMLDLHNLLGNFGQALPGGVIASACGEILGAPRDAFRQTPRAGMDAVVQQLAGTLAAHIQKMICWLRGLSHPDGEFSLFNDAAFGMAPASPELLDYARRQGFAVEQQPSKGLTHFAVSGYIRMVTDHACALLDVAPVGPDYLPGHAHADTLSFEMSLFGQRVFVNSGTSCYGTSAERLRQRGTAAHTTVVVAGRDSSEVWGGFRVARRAMPVNLELDVERLRVTCRHDGYRQLLRPGVWHHRQWQLSATALTVMDTVSPASHPAAAIFHLHPAVNVELDAGGSRGRLVLPGGRVANLRISGTAYLETSTYHPRFGVSECNVRIVLPLPEGSGALHLTWDK